MRLLEECQTTAKSMELTELIVSTEEVLDSQNVHSFLVLEARPLICLIQFVFAIGKVIRILMTVKENDFLQHNRVLNTFNTDKRLYRICFTYYIA